MQWALRQVSHLHTSWWSPSVPWTVIGTAAPPPPPPLWTCCPWPKSVAFFRGQKHGRHIMTGLGVPVVWGCPPPISICSSACLEQCRLHGTGVAMQNDNAPREHAGHFLMKVVSKVLKGSTLAMCINGNNSLLVLLGWILHLEYQILCHTCNLLCKTSCVRLLVQHAHSHVITWD